MKIFALVEPYLPQVNDKLYHIMLYITPWAGFEPTTSVVIGTDNKDSYISYDYDHDGPYLSFNHVFFVG
jgi:hypothetical protein